MKQFFVAYFSALTVTIIMDATWLYTMRKDFYMPNIGHLMSDSPKWVPVLAFYLLYALGLTVLVIVPALQHQTPLLKTYMLGAFFGLVAYGTYDLTNEATLKGWPFIITLVDLVWGTFLTGIVCLVSAYLTKLVASY